MRNMNDHDPTPEDEAAFARLPDDVKLTLRGVMHAAQSIEAATRGDEPAVVAHFAAGEAFIGIGDLARRAAAALTPA